MVLVSTLFRRAPGRRLNAVGRDVQSGPRTTGNNPRSSGDSQLGGGQAIAAAGLAPGPNWPSSAWRASGLFPNKTKSVKRRALVPGSADGGGSAHRNELRPVKAVAAQPRWAPL